MPIIQSIFLGIVQGLTEFLPVSSSGHLVLFQRLFGIKEEALFFDVMLHFGTVIPLFIIFRKDIWEIIKNPLKSKLLKYIILGTIPAVVVGLAFNNFFERIFSNGKSIGIEFIFTAAVLWMVETRRSGHKALEHLKPLDSVVIGIAQAVAIFPAVSRSGITIAGALFRNLDRKFAARFSFLLAIPSILGASILELKDISKEELTSDLIWPTLMGMVFAAAVGYFAIRWMMVILEKKTMKPFAVYVFILGVVIIGLQLAGKW